MKKLMTIPAGAILAAGMMLGQTTTAPATPGQPRGQWGQGQRRGMMMTPEQRLDRLAIELNLTPQQKTQAQNLMTQARQASEPIVAQLRQVHQQLIDAMKTNNTADIDKLSTNQGVLIGQLTAIRTKAMAQGYAMLTPEQKQKADQLRPQFGPMHGGPMMRRMGPRGGAGAPPTTPPTK
jgi:Spy/CpxP family protein refolding chaperone